MGQVGMSITSKYSLEAFHRDINAALSAGKFQRWLQEAGEIAYKVAYKLIPIDTGWMQGQLKLEVSSQNVSLECLADYASFHEYGWVCESYGGDANNPIKYKGGYRPFMRPGIIEGEKYLKRQIDNWVKKYLKYGK